MDNVTVRFAPSPTGYLHIGGARTAIFNWLYARQHAGKFILRIEDTDADRSNSESVKGILDSLTWLGINWDDGPYFQSKFRAEHQAAAKLLLGNGHAYKCFCTKKRLNEKRECAKKNKTNYQYDGTCRNLTPREVAEKEALDLPFTIRIKVPHSTGTVTCRDIVYGTIEKKYQDIEDFIIVRANGKPLYVLSNAVDDIRDGITHIIRGQDGLANTPKQILIYKGLGAPLPKFCHMPLTLDPRKAKISKRKHGEQVAVHYYRENGFLPWALVNFLVLLGWSHTDSREFFNREELLQSFNLKGINRANSVFNISADNGKHFTDPKLISINAHYLRNVAIEELVPYLKERFERAGCWAVCYEEERKAWFLSTMTLIRERFNTLEDFVTYGKAYVSDDFDMDASAVRKHLKKGVVDQWMPELAERLARLDEFDSNSIEAELRAFLKENNIKPAVLMNTVRIVLTGQGVGPDFLKMMTVLGKTCVVKRLTSVVELTT